jgi:hypothetical protein
MRVNPSPAFPLFIVIVGNGDTYGTDFGWIYDRGGERRIKVVIFYF